MYVKKAKGKVFGATFTANEQKAMNIEIEKQLAEHTRRHAIEIESMVLLVLHEQFGFGLTRLMRFSENFEPHLENLIAKYEMDDTDKAWLCTHKLKEYGIDVEKIYAEKGLV